MIWVGIAIGIIFTSIFGMTLLTIVAKQKGAPVPPELKEYWAESLRLQRLSIEGIVAIAEGISPHKQKQQVKRLLLFGKEPCCDDGWNKWYYVEVQPTTDNEGVMVIQVTKEPK